MSFERKIYLGLALTIGSFIPLIAALAFTVESLQRNQQSVIDAATTKTLLAERLFRLDAAKSGLMPAFLLSRDPERITAFHEQHQRFNQVLDELSLLDNSSQETQMLKSLREDSDMAASFVAPGIQMLNDGSPVAAIDKYFRSNSGPLAQKAGELAKSLALSARESERQAREEIASAVRHLEQLVVALAGLAVLLTGLACVMVVRVAKQKRQLDEQTARLSQARKEIVEVVAHDVKSPLASIRMAVELLQGEDAPVSKEILASSVGIIDRSSRAAMGLITDLLDHAKIESGRLVMEETDCNLGAVVEDVTTRFQLLAQAKRILVSVEMHGEDFVASCDVGRIDQALSNLIGNAIKFTPQGGSVQVTCRRDRHQIVVSVKDSGPGLSPEQIPHIFDRYWQARQQSRQGTGLGLSIVKSIVESHQGKIWVESQQGRGSSFVFSLPSQKSFASGIL